MLKAIGTPFSSPFERRSLFCFVTSSVSFFLLCYLCTVLFCRWLPDHVTLLARFSGEPSPVKLTVTKAVAEFRRTHADTWNVQKDSFNEEQLEVSAKNYELSWAEYYDD